MVKSNKRRILDTVNKTTMRIKNNDIKISDYLPLGASYLCNLGLIFLLVHQYRMLDRIPAASTELLISYWGVNVLFGILFISTLVLIVKTHPQELNNR